jgi:hypothetical protein
MRDAGYNITSGGEPSSPVVERVPFAHEYVNISAFLPEGHETRDQLQAICRDHTKARSLLGGGPSSPVVEGAWGEPYRQTLEAEVTRLRSLLRVAEQDREYLRDRAVCSGCGQDTDEGGACSTEGCYVGEMIPASDLPGALRDAMERDNELRQEIADEYIEAQVAIRELTARLETYEGGGSAAGSGGKRNV